MMLWRVTNLLSTSVSIEDLGITLQARGGEDGSTSISDEAKNSSRSLALLQNAKWVSVVPHNSSPKMPMWPISKPPPPPATPTVTAAVPPPPAVPVIAPPVMPMDPMMLETIRRLESTIAELASVIRSAPAAVATPPAGIPAVSIPRSEDPQFIPSNIVPTDVNVEIHARPEETSVPDFEQSASSLKNMRRRKRDG